MKIAKVIGSVVSTIKNRAYSGRKLMIVQALDTDLEPQEETFLAVDSVGAGEGETVLVMSEGIGARQILDLEVAPLRSVIVGVIDSVDREA